MLGWPDSGFSYKRLATSLKLWLGVSLVYENAWWDKRQQAWTTRGFHVLDNFELNDSRAGGGRGDFFPSNILWNEVLFESFEAGYLKTIDYDMYIRLEHPTAKRLYRFLSKRAYHRPDWTFDLRELAFEHIGLSRGYSGDAGKIKEKLQPAIDELEATGFLETMSKDDRYRKDGRDWKIRLVSRPNTPSLPLLDGVPTIPEESGPVAELVKRGVTKVTAADLMRRHPAETIQAKLDVFDWLMEKQDKRVAKSPAGYLVKSITDDYAPPQGFVSKAERRRREDARRAEERQAAEDRRRQKEEESRERDAQKVIAAYWGSLTAEQQAGLDAAADAAADPELMAMEDGPLKRIGRRLRRHGYIEQLLKNREPVAAKA
jgi:hypothetical protein